MFLATIFCLLSVSHGLLFGLLGSPQSTSVKGLLTCNGKPSAHTRIKLFEKEMTIDVLMAEGTTDENGEFEISGYKTEVTTIDPRLNIYHKCNYEGILSSACYKKVKISIPKNFVTDGKTPNKTFDIGTINLAGRFGGDSTDCIN